MIISAPSFFSTTRISLRAAQRHPQRRQLTPPYRLSAPPNMFTYDGIHSQLEWNSTLSPAKALQPTKETKFLRKVAHPLCWLPTQCLQFFLDRYHRDDRCNL